VFPTIEWHVFESREKGHVSGYRATEMARIDKKEGELVK
jgi:hypothetical protein